MEQVKKILFNKIEPFIQFLRTSRRTFTLRTIIVSISTIIVLFSIFSFILFRYYSGVIETYYSTILRDAYLYAPYFVKTKNYGEDFGLLCRKLKQRKGINEVWVVDRTGKLVYHTNESIMNNFFGKRLPEEYRQSIEKVWQFSGGYPVINFIKVGSYLKLRASVPLYITGKGMYDFILGIDADRFLIPSNFFDRIFFYTIISGFIISIAVILIPMYFWAGNMIDNVSTNTRIMAGTLESDLTKVLSTAMDIGIKKSAEVQEEITKEKQPTREEVSRAKKVKNESGLGVKEEEKVAGEKGTTQKQELIQKPFDKNIPAPMLLIDKKQKLLQKKKLETQYFKVGAFSLRTRTPYGNYVLYFNKNKAHLFFNFLCTEDNISGAIVWIEELHKEVERVFQEVDEIHNLFFVLNDYLLKNQRSLNLSTLFIEESSKKIFYTSFGSFEASYVKSDSESLKSIKLNLPSLGEVQTDELKHMYEYSEIDFAAGDLLFLKPPPEVCRESGIDFMELLKGEIIKIKSLEPDGIISVIQDKLESAIKDRNTFPEFGFVVAKYL